MLIGWVTLFSGACGAAEQTPVDPPKTVGKPATDLTFCFWNVENLFDDKDDKRNTVDEDYDNPFADDSELRKHKYDRIAATLLKMNNGQGPDVIACAEVETVRAAELLMAALNAKISDETMKYRSVAMKNLDAGRHIATCVISRRPLSQITTKLHGRYQRILETHLILNNHDLTILATHWTSKIRREDGTDGEAGRRNYANTVAGVTSAILKKKPDADIVVCGDFNDTPESDPVMKSLRAVGDREAVKTAAGSDRPLLLDLMAGKDPTKFGTLWYDNKPMIYDHICVSSGMLDDKGWTCAPASLQTITAGLIRPGSSRRQPWRYDDPGRRIKLDERGFSDHFPVVVKLSVAP